MEFESLTVVIILSLIIDSVWCISIKLIFFYFIRISTKEVGVL